MLGQVINVAALSLVGGAAVFCLPLDSDPQQHPTRIRSGVVLVPVDVRVLDAEGNPVTDLTAEDFALYENGVQQEIAHFMALSFSGSGDHQATLQLRRDDPLTAAANVHRTFIIVLGRGRLNGPVRGIDSLIAFVKERLVASDRVGVVAYLRTSEPSTDHGAVVRFLELYRDRHEDLEGRILRDFRQALGLVTLSGDTRRRIDALFRSEGIPTFADLPGAGGTTASRYLNRTYLRRTLQGARGLAGEKHVIVVSQNRLPLGRITDNPDRSVLVRWANEARAALTYINTGGLSGFTMFRGRLFIPRGSGSRDASAMGIPDTEFFGPTDHRLFARYTGGIAAFYQYAWEPLADLERASRFQYLLGYYPVSPASPETYRTLRVVVKTRGVRAQYRHGYRLASAPDDETQFRTVISEEAVRLALARLAGAEPRTRLTAARVAAPSLKVRIGNRHVMGATELPVSISFDPMRVALAADGNTYRSTLYLAVVVDDAEGHAVGEVTRTLDLTLTSDEFARAKKHWLGVDISVSVKGSPARVRAALYDYDADRVMAGRSAIK